jgi:hypothetical protein
MTSDDRASGNSPQISLKQVSLAPGESGTLWRIGWSVENCSENSLRIEAARFPHGQFRSDEQILEPPFNLGGGESAEFTAVVACDAKPGTIVENAFIIFSAIWRDSLWRIFVRLRVSVNKQGEPAALTELITTQRVGFSVQLQSDSEVIDKG